MKKFVKALCLIISLSMLLSCFIVIPAQAVEMRTSVDHDFEDMQTGTAPIGANWTTEGTGGTTALAQIRDAESKPNKALHLNHYDLTYNKRNITATHLFPNEETAVSYSFNFMYDSMSAVNSEKGGVYISLVGSASSYIAIVKPTNQADDNTAKLIYKGGETDFTSIRKNVWYHFEVSVASASSGSTLTIAISSEGEDVFNKSFTVSKIQTNGFSITNSGRDPHDSYWFDDISIKAGDYTYEEDFEDEVLGASVASDDWTVTCPDSYDEAYIYIKTHLSPDKPIYEKETNRFMRLKHYYENASNIVATTEFPSSSGVKFKFDFLYESLSPAKSTDGGAYISFYNGGTLAQMIRVTKSAAGSDDVAKIEYRNNYTMTTAFSGLNKNVWYTIELYVVNNATSGSRVEFNITSGGNTVFSESFYCGQTFEINKICIGNGSSRDNADSYCFDNLSLKTDHGYSYTEDFETATVGASVSELGWAVTCGWGTYNDNDVHIRVYEVNNGYRRVAVSNKALYIEDNSVGSLPKATRFFEPSKTVIAEFDFMLKSDEMFCAAVFGLAAGSSTYGASRGWFAIYPNKDGAGAYSGSGNLKYYNSGYKATSVTSIQKDTWYKFRLEAEEGKNTVALYVNGNKVMDVPTFGSGDEIDRIVFMAGGSDQVGDEFFVDNLKIETAVPEPAKEFNDSLSGTALPAEYKTVGDVSLASGIITANGAASVTRMLSADAADGEFSFSFKASELDYKTEISLTSDGVSKILLRVREDGALEYRRPTLWEDVWFVVNTMIPDENGVKTPKAAIKADEWTDITLRLPYDRNNSFVYVYVNGEYVGNALYASPFYTVDGIKVESFDDNSVSVKNFKFIFDTVGVIKAPERTEDAPVTYLPLVIEGSRAMYLEGDSKPNTGAMSYADESTSIQINKKYNSIGVDLGEKQQVNAIRITTEAPDEATVTNTETLCHRVYVSDDNVNYTYVGGQIYNHFLENGKWTILVEFSGVEARYVKLTRIDSKDSSKYEDPAIIVNPLGNIRPEAKINRQYKMAGDFIWAMGAETAPENTLMTRNYTTAEALTFTSGDSIGLNMGILNEVESVELVGDGLDLLDKNDIAVYISNDNYHYTKIEDVVLSRDSRDGKEVYRLSFDSVQCVYVKLYAAGEDVSVKLDSIKDGFAVYSSKEVDSALVNYSSVRSGEGAFYTLPDGTIVMMYIGFTLGGGGHDYSNYIVLATASLDGGKSWGEPWIMVALPEWALSVSMAKVFHVDGEPGHMKMVYRIIFTLEDSEKGYGAEYYWVESFDYGRNWENPIPIIQDDYPDTFGGGSSGNQITRLSNGRIIYSNSIYKYQKDDYGASVNYRQFISGYVYYSDDEGKTWTRSDTTIIMPSNCDETSIAECANGDLLLTLRTRDANGIYQSISTDNGVTWSQPVAVEGMDSPSSTNVVTTIPATGDILLVWNNQPWDASNQNGTRIPLTMGVTADNGLTYHNYRNLCEWSASWPNVYYYGRNVLIQTSNRNSTLDVAMLYHTVSGVKTIADLTPAATPTASYKDGWLTGVSANMQYSLDGGTTWKFCGGTSVQIGEVSSLMVKDIGTHEYAPSAIQTVK